jgi:hypothetical protein
MAGKCIGRFGQFHVFVRIFPLTHLSSNLSHLLGSFAQWLGERGRAVPVWSHRVQSLLHTHRFRWVAQNLAIKAYG